MSIMSCISPIISNTQDSTSSKGYCFTVRSKRSNDFEMVISLNAIEFDLGERKVKNFLRIPDRDYTISLKNIVSDDSLSRVPEFTISYWCNRRIQTLVQVDVDQSLQNWPNIQKILEKIDCPSHYSLPVDLQGQCQFAFKEDQDSASTSYQQITSYLDQLCAKISNIRGSIKSFNEMFAELMLGEFCNEIALYTKGIHILIELLRSEYPGAKCVTCQNPEDMQKCGCVHIIV